MHKIKFICENQFVITANVDENCIVSEIIDELKKNYKFNSFQLHFRGRILSKSEKLSKYNLKGNPRIIIHNNSRIAPDFQYKRSEDTSFLPRATGNILIIKHDEANDNIEIKKVMEVFNCSQIARNILILFYPTPTKYKEIMTLAFNEGILCLNGDLFELITCSSALESLKVYYDALFTSKEVKAPQSIDVVQKIFNYFHIEAPIDTIQPIQKVGISRAAQLIKNGINILKKQNIDVFPDLFNDDCIGNPPLDIHPI